MAEVTTQVAQRELEALIDDYEQARLREEAAKKDKEVAREGIIEAFKLGGMRDFRDSKGRVTRVDTRFTRRINFKEAEAMLDSDTLKKLTQETAYLVVVVRYKPKMEEAK